jgi:hypothetical protein
VVVVVAVVVVAVGVVAVVVVAVGVGVVVAVVVVVRRGRGWRVGMVVELTGAGAGVKKWSVETLAKVALIKVALTIAARARALTPSAARPTAPP